MTQTAAFLVTNLGLTATVDEVRSTVPVSGLGYDRLADVQPRHRLRINGATAAIVFDHGASVSLDALALISTSLTSDATVRVRASVTDPAATSSLSADSSVQSNVADEAWNGNVVYCAAAPFSARYVRVDITVGAGPIDIGLIPMGLLWRPGRNFGFGCSEGWIDPSPRDTNPDTGAEFTVIKPRKRFKQMTFEQIDITELRGLTGSWDEFDRVIGTAGDTLYVEDSDETSWLKRAQASMWGGFRQPGGAALAALQQSNVFSRTVQLTERL